MENATKALLIAAAVLIAIIIISLTLGVVNQGKEATQNVDLSEAEILAHNSKFTQYEGTKVSASEVNILLQTILTFNQNAETEDDQITLDSDDVEIDVATGKITTKAVSTATYTVETVLTNGIVTKITISEN